MFGEWWELVADSSVDAVMGVLAGCLSPDAEAILTPFIEEEGCDIAEPNFDSFDDALIKEIHNFIHSWLTMRDGKCSMRASYSAWDVQPLTLDAPAPFES